jgi:pimeloyl-ACP methyl ester carboxylesterase
VAGLRVKQSPARLAACTLSVLLALCGCANRTERARHAAQQGGLAASIVQGTRYRHEIFVSNAPHGAVLYVFIEGDGSPWSGNGREPERDPTPRRALALELAVRTPRPVMYLGRPCYFSARSDVACRPSVWTSERYSSTIVESLVQVVNRFVADNAYRSVILIGYSGGGTLAVLMAPYIPTTAAVVTIGANLDVAAWSSWHGYLALEGSLSPAAQAPLRPDIRQWHLVGGRDLIVPESVSRRYLDTLRPDEIWRFPSFDHACCWVEEWPNILARIDAALGG